MNFKLILFTILLALPSVSLAESQSIPKFRGLNNADAAVLIGDDESQDLQDVDITPSGNGVKKRAGYTQFRTIGNSTHPVRGGYYFRDTSANDVLVNTNLRSIYKSLNGGAYSAFVTTDTAGSYYDFTDSQGYLWRANSSRDEILRYDGTTVTYYPSAPKGDQIEALPDRLAISGTSAAPNTVNFSAAADFTNFVTGTNETDPFTETFGLPGQKVNAIKWALGNLMVWTKTTTSIWNGTNQFDGRIDDVSLTVGTNQPYSVVFDQGVVYWQGQDRHFYAFDGNNMQKISEVLDVSNIVSGESRSWLTTSQSEFEAGTSGDGLSASASPGNEVFSDVTIDAFADGDYTSSPVWTTYALSAGSFSVSSNRLRYSQPSNGFGGIYAASPFSVGTWSVTFNTSASGTDNGFVLNTGVPTGFNGINMNSSCSSSSDGYYLSTNGSSNQILFGKCNGGTLTNLITVSKSQTTGVDHTFTLERTSLGEFSVYYDGSLQGTATDTTFTSFPYFSLITASNGGATSTDFDDIEVGYFTSVYQSQSFNIGTAITSWGSFDVNSTLNSGTLTYAFYVDSDASITLSNPATFTSSQTITSGSIPTVAVGPYAVWVATFSRTASTQNPTLNDITVNWYEGAITKHWGTVDKDHRIMWSVAEGVATVPNVTYIYDPRFDSWLKYSVAFDAPVRVGDNIYFGDTDEGKVYKWPSGNTDNGSAITAYWKSKNFISGDPFTEKIFTRYSFLGKESVGSNLDITYTIDGTAGTVANYSLTDPLSSVSRRINSNLPSGTKGSIISWKFGNDDADAPFELHGFSYEYTRQPWRVLP